MTDLIALNHMLHFSLKMELVTLVLGLIRKGVNNVPDQPQGHLLPDSPSPRLSAISLDCSVGQFTS